MDGRPVWARSISGVLVPPFIVVFVKKMGRVLFDYTSTLVRAIVGLEWE